MISCNDLCKKYSDRMVLSGININVGAGEIFGLLGPSGAGKTTLIRILTGQLAFDRGTVKVMDKNVLDLNGEDRKKIGIMMDSFGVYERFSCRDNLKIFADIYGVNKDRILQTLEDVGLGEAAGRRAMDLSKGMRARLQLARVFMHSPKIMFLDEPTSGLDPQTMKQIHSMILDKKNEGCTIFLTTHNMEEAAQLCDNVALLNEGVIAESGAPGELVRRYNHQKKIRIHLITGDDMELPQDAESAGMICTLMKEGKVETIHSSEPDLETVFLELTGRKLEEVC